MGIVRSSEITADVAIVGGGVAGSSLAAVLEATGLHVVLIEREARFRDRVRGESIHPWGVTQIEALGLGDVIRAAGAQILPIRRLYANRESGEPSRWDSIDPALPSEWSIYHPALQEALLDHARESGVDVLRPARVTSFNRSGRVHLAVEAEDTTFEIRARLVVGADGRQSAVRRWIGAQVVHDPVHHLVGGCLLDGVALEDDSFHLGGFDGGEVLLFPQGNRRARTYIVGSDEIVGPLRGQEHVPDYIAMCAAVFPEGSFDDVCATGPLAFFPNADVWSDRLYDDRVVLIGDAAGANDPSGGHGLSLCFRDVREIRDQLLADADWDSAMRAYADRRTAYYSVMRAVMQWQAPMYTGVGPHADAMRERARRARQHDPSLGGFGRILGYGPDGLVADEAARRHYLGEDID